MRAVIFGSTDFTVRCIEATLETPNIDVVGVVSQPNRKKDRKGNIVPSDISRFCEERQIPEFQPESINAEESVNVLEWFAADIFIVVAYGQLLNQQILDLPPEGAYNIHASLLPYLRGASPIEHALLRGDKETGVTLQKMALRMDAGNIILMNTIAIGEDWTYHELYAETKRVGMETLLTFYEDIKGYRAKAYPQDESKAIRCGKIDKEDGLVKWNDIAWWTHNKVRAYARWPVAYTFHEGKNLRIYRSSIVPLDEATLAKTQIGAILDLDPAKGVLVRAGDAALLLRELQLEGKKKQTARDFVNGCRFKIGDMLG